MEILFFNLITKKYQVLFERKQWSESDTWTRQNKANGIRKNQLEVSETNEISSTKQIGWLQKVWSD